MSRVPSFLGAFLAAGTALGCAPEREEEAAGACCKESDADTDVDADTDADADTGTPPDVEGPDLPACTATGGDPDTIALSGVVLAPDGPVAGHVVYRPSTGLVTCAGDCDVTGATVVCTEGVISPGLLDPHNHLQYNSLPPWQVAPEFDDRYEWRSDGRYWDYRTAFDEIADAYLCEIMQWAEAREIIHGTTSVVGSSGGACIGRLARNLDEDADASHLDGYEITYSASTVSDSVDPGSGATYRSRLDGGQLDAVINHVAEGRNGSVRDEIDWMIEAGMTGPGQAYVHASDASTEQLAQMAATGTAILWSPRSNLALYGTTTPIEIADRMGVPWAIGTDWTPSGSMAPIEELACAAAWLRGKGNPLSDVDLWRKATEDAARIVGADGVLGSIRAGAPADLAVFDWSRTPYRQIVDGGAEKVRLVLVGGETVYGQAELVTMLARNAAWCDTLDVCGTAKQLCLQAGETGDFSMSLAEVETTLATALGQVSMPAGYEYAGALFGLFECGATADACDLAEPTADDADGDGIADASDRCPSVYDPAQWDSDGDGEGDSCDPCPLLADATECGITADDLDGDGVGNDADNCDTAGNPGQEDADGDGIGDACDACPAVSAPDGVCPATMGEVQAGAFEQGSQVRVEDAVVTAVVASVGFYAQDSTGGAFVYDGGSNAVARGDLVAIVGTYIEYYDETELSASAVAVTGSAEEPAAQDVDACDVAADGESLEGILVRVADVAVSDLNPDDPEDYDEFEVQGCLRVDDRAYAELDQPTSLAAYDAITGVLGYTYGAWKLLPREAADLQ